MKDAANCVTHLELQISEKDKDSERIPRVGLAQLTWLAVTAICSRPNSEVCSVISCRRSCADVIVEVSVFSFRTPMVASCSVVFERYKLRFGFPNFFTHDHDQSREYPLNLSI